MQEFDSITALKQDAPSVSPLPNTAVYVKGYFFPGDGGGGIFLWRTESDFKDLTGYYQADNGGTIIKSTGSVFKENGRWVRQYDDFISVAYFGAVNKWVNITVMFQSAIDFAQKNARATNRDTRLKGCTVFIPDGIYILTSLTLRDGVTIMGESIYDTLIYPESGTTSPAFLLNQELGRVTTNISNLSFNGKYTGGSWGTDAQGNPILNCPRGILNLTADFGSVTPDGGIHYSSFKNIYIRNFDKTAILFKGGTGETPSGNNDKYLLPEQLSIFENVRVVKGPSSLQFYALHIEGQVGQVTFINCAFDGAYAGQAIVGQYANVFIKGIDANLADTDHNEFLSPAVISFINGTFQNSRFGVQIESASNITFDTCWFERLHVGVQVLGNAFPSKSVNVINSLFNNVSGFGTIIYPVSEKINGSCIQISKSYVNVLNNNVITSGNIDDVNNYYDPSCKFIYAFNDILGVNVAGNTFSSKRLSECYGIVAIITITTSDADLKQHRFVQVSLNSGITISKITSTLAPTESLTIRAMTSLRFKKSSSATENIYFSSSSSVLTLQVGDVVTFTKSDVTYENIYLLTSIVRANP